LIGYRDYKATVNFPQALGRDIYVKQNDEMRQVSGDAIMSIYSADGNNYDGQEGRREFFVLAQRAVTSHDKAATSS